MLPLFDPLANDVTADADDFSDLNLSHVPFLVQQNGLLATVIQFTGAYRSSIL